MHRHRIHSRNAYQRRGYTLIEMVISTTVGGVLVAGLASSLYIASQSLDVDSGSLGDKRVARRALARLHHDAQSAISVSELTNKRVTMTVPDRNGDSVPETIRYDWSGTAGDPLTLEYNGGTATTLADNVQSFSLAWVSRLLEGVAAQPIVLFVSGQSVGSNEVMATPSSSEQLRVNVLEGWGFSVTVISQHALPSEFDVALANSNVAYVSGEVSSLVLGTKLNAAISGVVTESFGHAGVLGFYGSFTASGVDSTQINIIDTNHYITSGLNTGNLQIVSSAERMKLTSSTIAPDATVLAKAGSPVAYPSLLVLNAGDELAGGATALGRRCQLPWGEYGFNAANLNSNGQSLARRAIEWAAGAEAVANGSGGVVFQNYADQKSGVIGSTSTAINTPTGTNEGDLLVAVVAADGNDPIAPPAGWNQVAMQVGSNRVAMGVWWKLAGNNEAAAHAFTWAPSNEQSYGWIMRFTGHDPTNPIHASAVDTGPSGSPVNPAVSTSVNNCMILRIGGFDDDDVSVGDTGLAGHTTINMDKSHSGHGTVSGGAGYIVQPSAGSSGVANFSLGGPEEYVTVTIAIAPNPTP